MARSVSAAPFVMARTRAMAAAAHSGSASLCLPILDFETDTAGAALVAGQIIDTEWAAWGVRVTTSSPSNHPAMIFNSRQSYRR